MSITGSHDRTTWCCWAAPFSPPLALPAPPPLRQCACRIECAHRLLILGRSPIQTFCVAMRGALPLLKCAGMRSAELMGSPERASASRTSDANEAVAGRDTTLCNVSDVNGGSEGSVSVGGSGVLICSLP